MISWLNDKYQNVDKRCPALYSYKDEAVFLVFEIRQTTIGTEEWVGVCIHSTSSGYELGKQWVFVNPEKDLQLYGGYVTLHL